MISLSPFKITSLLIAPFLISACADGALTKLFGGESMDIRDMSKAQNCLDKVPANNPDAANSCFEYVKNQNSQQANILKCSILLTSGGLNSDKIVKAYKISKDSSISNKEAAYIGFLALRYPTEGDGYTISQKAYPYCVQSKVTGLEFIGGLAKAASMIAAKGGFDFDNPTDIGQAFEGCVNGGCDLDELADLGATVVSLADGYCSNPSSDQNVCNDINNAIQNAGGDVARAAKEFLCQVQKKNYDEGSGTCM